MEKKAGRIFWPGIVNLKGLRTISPISFSPTHHSQWNCGINFWTTRLIVCYSHHHCSIKRPEKKKKKRQLFCHYLSHTKKMCINFTMMMSSSRRLRTYINALNNTNSIFLRNTRYDCKSKMAFTFGQILLFVLLFKCAWLGVWEHWGRKIST